MAGKASQKSLDWKWLMYNSAQNAVIERSMAKPTTVDPHPGTLLRREWELLKHATMWIRKTRKNIMFSQSSRKHGHIYGITPMLWSSRTSKTNLWWRKSEQWLSLGEREGGVRIVLEGVAVNSLRVMTMFLISVGVSVVQVYTRSYPMVHLQLVNFLLKCPSKKKVNYEHVHSSWWFACYSV